MDTKKIPPFWTGSPCRLRENWAGSSGAGFDMMGTVPSTKNAWAPKTPVFFSWWALYPVLNTAGHLDPAPPSKFCPSPWDTGHWVHDKAKRILQGNLLRWKWNVSSKDLKGKSFWSYKFVFYWQFRITYMHFLGVLARRYLDSKR